MKKRPNFIALGEGFGDSLRTHFRARAWWYAPSGKLRYVGILYRQGDGPNQTAKFSHNLGLDYASHRNRMRYCILDKSNLRALAELLLQKNWLVSLMGRKRRAACNELPFVLPWRCLRQAKRPKNCSSWQDFSDTGLQQRLALQRAFQEMWQTADCTPVTNRRHQFVGEKP